MREYKTPSKEEFTKLYGNDMVEIIAKDYNMSPKIKVKTYFDEFPIRKNKRRIYGKQDSIIVDKDGKEFPYIININERNEDKLIDFDYIYNIEYKTLEYITNELNLHLKTEECKICESGGVTSAVACNLAIKMFGKDSCRVLMIDTKNEDEDTYRFKKDCEEWYGLKIETITTIGNKYENIQDVWLKNKSLNVATGAICSSELKRKVREEWEKENNFDYQIFGFEFDRKEFNRAMGLKFNHPKTNAIFPLLMYGYTKKDCLNIISEADIKVPKMYKLGFKNNNCFKTGVYKVELVIGKR